MKNKPMFVYIDTITGQVKSESGEIIGMFHGSLPKDGVSTLSGVEAVVPIENSGAEARKRGAETVKSRFNELDERETVKRKVQECEALQAELTEIDKRKSELEKEAVRQSLMNGIVNTTMADHVVASELEQVKAKVFEAVNNSSGGGSPLFAENVQTYLNVNEKLEEIRKGDVEYMKNNDKTKDQERQATERAAHQLLENFIAKTTEAERQYFLKVANESRDDKTKAEIYAEASGKPNHEQDRMLGSGVLVKMPAVESRWNIETPPDTPASPVGGLFMEMSKALDDLQETACYLFTYISPCLTPEQPIKTDNSPRTILDDKSAIEYSLSECITKVNSLRDQISRVINRVSL